MEEIEKIPSTEAQNNNLGLTELLFLLFLIGLLVESIAGIFWSLLIVKCDEMFSWVPSAFVYSLIFVYSGIILFMFVPFARAILNRVKSDI